MQTLKSQPVRTAKSFRKSTPTKEVRGYTPDVLDANFLKDFFLNLLLDTTHLVSQYTLSDYAKDSKTLLSRFENEGVGFATKTLPVLFSGLQSLLEHGSVIFPGFKIKSGTNYPLFLNRLFSIIVNNAYTDEISGDEEQAIKCIYQLSVAFKKIKGPYPHKVLLQKFVAFADVDAQLKDLSLDVDNDPILRTSITLANTFFKDVDIDEDSFLPRPGPGATNTPRKMCDRYEPHIMYTEIDRVLPYDVWFYSHPWDVVDQSRHYLTMKNNSVEGPSSRFKFVQKKVGEPRGICIEENEVQFLQQAIRRGIQKTIERDKLISKRIVFNDQSVNATLALTASKHRRMATLDESEASDRISRELVRMHLSANTPLRDVLLALSTKKIVPPREIEDDLRVIDEDRYYPFLRTEKFAPMGSALCFPIMSLIHFFLVRSIILHSGQPNCVTDSKVVFVYGDDIVIPSLYASLVYEKLPRYGMKLNENKSFYKSFFRESCGMHAYKGKEITPVFLKHTPLHTTVGSLFSCLQVEHDLHKRGYCFTSGFMRHEILKRFKHLQVKDAYVPDDSFLVGFKRASHCYTTPLIFRGYKTRWNKNLQCNEYRVPMFEKASIERNIIKKQNSAYLRWLVQNVRSSAQLGRFPDPVAVGDSSIDYVIRWKWKPRSALKGVH